MAYTPKLKLVQKLFSISPRNVEMIDELTSTGRFSSQSDVIRQALARIYDQEIKKEGSENEKT